MVQNLEWAWVSAFADVFERCAMQASETIVVLSESQSRADNVQLAKLALGALKLPFYALELPSPPDPTGPIVKSSGATLALTGQGAAVRALQDADVVIDLTVEGLMHAPETASILQSGARIMNISHEHPAVLARLAPCDDLKTYAKAAVKQIRAAQVMTVQSNAGTDLRVNMQGAATVGVWGWTDRPGTLAHWPGGIIVSFPKPGSVNGQIVFQPGDINLTFKRYFESRVAADMLDDFVCNISGQGADAKLMHEYFASFGDANAYATSHVGWGFNPNAQYEALTMYDKADTNGTELRALAGNFLYSTGANEFAGRFTRGHFDLPMLGCDIALDGELVVAQGALVP